jgi:C_GCAxxG_C_C family probable redox protein
MKKANLLNLKNKAVDNFKGGFNCAESTLLALSDNMNIHCKYIPQISTCFGAGFGRHGEVCGALTGALMAIGLQHGRKDSKDLNTKEKAYLLADRLLKKFEKKFGNIRCSLLIDCNLLTPEGQKKAKDENVHKKICSNLVAFTASEAARILKL